MDIFMLLMLIFPTLPIGCIKCHSINDWDLETRDRNQLGYKHTEKFTSNIKRDLVKPKNEFADSIF